MKHLYLYLDSHMHTYKRHTHQHTKKTYAHIYMIIIIAFTFLDRYWFGIQQNRHSARIGTQWIRCSVELASIQFRTQPTHSRLVINRLPVGFRPLAGCMHLVSNHLSADSMWWVPLEWIDPTILPLHLKWGAQLGLPFVWRLWASPLTNILSSCQSHSHWCVSSQCASAFLQAHLKSNGICWESIST